MAELQVKDAAQATDWMEESRQSSFNVGLDDDANAEEVSLDLSQIEERFLLPVGKYPARVMKVEKKISQSEAQTVYSLVHWEIIAGPMKGKKVQDRLMESGGGSKRLVSFLQATGLLPEEAVKAKQKDWKFSRNQFVGRCAWISVIHEENEYRGEKRLQAKISWDGFEDINKFPPPPSNDPFAEAGDIGPATAPGGTRTAPPAWP